LLLVTCLVAAGLAFIMWHAYAGHTVYDTAAASRGDIQVTVNAIGTLQPRRYVDVGAQVSGQVTRLHVQPGDNVKQGQLLVEIDPSVQQAVVDAGRAAIAGLRAQLAEQQAQHRLAGQRHARQRRMAADGATRDEDVQTAHAELAAAKARVEYLRAQIAQMQASQRAEEARLGYTQIYAPMAGTVVTVDAREGQTLNATYQTPNILRIADLSGMTVWTEVSEADIHSIKTGMPVSFSTLGLSQGEPRRWESTVRQVLPAPVAPTPAEAGAAQPASGTRAVTYTVLFDVDNADGALMPQMTAQVAFLAAQAHDTLLAPLAALSLDGGRSVLRVLERDGSVTERMVRLGVRSRHQAQILEGLEEGEQLVIAEHPGQSGFRWLQW